MYDRILVTEPEADVDAAIEHQTAVGQMDATADDEESKENLRTKLRNTLSKKQSLPDVGIRQRKKGRSAEMSELTATLRSSYPPRQYFVLTNAGKPVFTTLRDEYSVEVASSIGIMQALISVFLDDQDKIRSINAGSCRITFLLRQPLYYVCVSSWGEPESVTRLHLDYLHLQILSVVTAQQLKKLFERRTNFDLRRLLGGAEPFMHTLLQRLEGDMAINMSSLQFLKLDQAIRSRAAEALIPVSKMKDMLYIVLIAAGRIITLVRPKKHSIHSTDLHILLNTVHAPSIYNNSASASWLPICLPKFNSTGFVNTYVNFVRRDGDSNGPDSGSGDGENGSTTGRSPSPGPSTTSIGLICVTGEPEFDVIRAWGENVIQRLEREGSLDAISNAIRSGGSSYSVSELGIPGLRHFFYKSRSHVQVTGPEFEEPYEELQERRRLITLYQLIHDALHGKSGQEKTLKLQYIRTEKEGVLGWITQPFELYATLSPILPKSAVIGAANAVVKWVKKEESKLFLRDAPTF
ncbi:vacuolar fusion protein MON1 [Thelephora terrestris]|uniref:Vacuolar fusion protein MON1 n=1 Tax=Thelephora terrestris TaxID=56493 RepID=A0A9P6H438_9AGAM|nr:vacuolar fusion protein MON1 [Thelephora terrestris]